ncbi:MULTISPECIES: LysR family transcriptional regulator [Pseudomonas]|uniref:LysR family transcriptional regulator n=1 Tax=Pseudomonas TaxID=286 RepID=UPI0015E3ABA0|nr:MULTISPECIES: LysR family transcriptional regulator [Pseudomonas]MBA1289030.1 LysR family transcriptional regulator [Pseudomonas japonica]
MNIRFLETFVWVARLKSFRLTAEKLCTTQASISSRIAALEDELDSRLFVRDPRGVTLTPEGQRVLDYAERMVDTLHALKAALKDPGLARGHLRIGAMDTVIHTWLSPLVSRISAAWPGVEVEITADTARNLCDQLEKGYQDIILQTDMVRLDTVRNALLDRYPMHWVVAQGAPQDRPYDDLRALASERIVTFSRNSRPHQDLLNLLHGADLINARVNCVNSASAIIRLIRDGFGIGLMPLPLVEAELRAGSLKLIEGIEPPPPMDIVASWRTGPGMALSESVVAMAQALIAETSEPAA